VNTDTYNQGPCGTSGDGDGDVMFYALGNYATVDEFQRYLDSTNVIPRRSTHCYGVFDAFGGAAIFEAGRDYYVRFNADEALGGVLVRTNYADSGFPSPLTGAERRRRAEEILAIPTVVDPSLFLFTIARDLVTAELDPYPLPFTGSFDGLPTGVISVHHSINRYYSSSASVLVGASKEGLPAVMWEFLGQPVVAIPIPLWVQAGAVPYACASPTGSELCDFAIEFKTSVYNGPMNLNTFNLSAIMNEFLPCEQLIYAQVESMYNDFPTTDEEISFKASAFAAQILDKYRETMALYVKEKSYARPTDAFLSFYPNPFNGAGCIRIYSNETGIAQIDLFDLNGRQVRSALNSTQVFPGESSFGLNLSDLPGGVYFARLTISGKTVASCKLVYLK
jgi:hypothetical protein